MSQNCFQKMSNSCLSGPKTREEIKFRAHCLTDQNSHLLVYNLIAIVSFAKKQSKANMFHSNLHNQYGKYCCCYNPRQRATHTFRNDILRRRKEEKTIGKLKQMCECSNYFHHNKIPGKKTAFHMTPSTLYQNSFCLYFLKSRIVPMLQRK